MDPALWYELFVVADYLLFLSWLPGYTLCYRFKIKEFVFIPWQQ